MYDTQPGMPTVYTNTIAQVNEIMRNWMQLGVFIHNRTNQRNERGYHKAYVCGPLLAGPTFRSFARQCAREMKRPFIVAQHTSWRGDELVELTIPHRKFLAPLLTPFSLLPESGEGEWAWRNGKGRVYIRRRPTVTVIMFREPATNEYWQKFIERCQTDEGYRKAMKLT